VAKLVLRRLQWCLLPIERGRPGPGLLAHVAVAKYADGLPLYRQSAIYAREGIAALELAAERLTSCRKARCASHPPLRFAQRHPRATRNACPLTCQLMSKLLMGGVNE
jgi:transposase